MPVVFSQPVLPSSITPEVFRVTLNNGTIVTPAVASLVPNVEYNERSVVVITGYFGNRLPAGTDGSIYPVQLEIVAPDPTNPLILLGPNGFTNGTGLTVSSGNPYTPGGGPRIVFAKLNAFSQLGEGCPIWVLSAFRNSGSDLYGWRAQYRIRLFTSAGFSPDGIAGINPPDFSKFFFLTATDSMNQTVNITKAGVFYPIEGCGKVMVVGLADCGGKSFLYNSAYVEDHDNQYDIILRGDYKAVTAIRSVVMPSSGEYSPVYNPGGPGNDPQSNPPGVPFTVPSDYQEVVVTNDIANSSVVTYVEVDGPVLRNSQGQPVGQLLGPAIINKRTGYTINAYKDAQGNEFFASFPVSST